MLYVSVPLGFVPPVVEEKGQGIGAFHAYDWYYSHIKSLILKTEKVFLVPCAKKKPIYSSPLHRGIYQKISRVFKENDYQVFVVSEPAVLIDYGDLTKLEDAFLYDFPPTLLNEESRQLFVSRLNELLAGKDIVGCLPRHHASLVRDAIGDDWINLWEGGIFQMMKKAKTPQLLKKEVKNGSGKD